MTDRVIRACPYCGDDGEVKRTLSWSGYRYTVNCCYCGAKTGRYHTEDNAIDDWNSRIEDSWPNILARCPICGSNAILEEHHSHQWQWNPCLKVYRVCCPRCSMATKHYGKTADAIEAWTRMAGEKMKNDEDKLEKVKNLSWIDGKLDMVVRMVDDIQTDEANYKCLDETQRTRLTNLWNEAVDTMLSVGISLEELQKEGKA